MSCSFPSTTSSRGGPEIILGRFVGALCSMGFSAPRSLETWIGVVMAWFLLLHTIDD